VRIKCADRAGKGFLLAGEGFLFEIYFLFAPNFYLLIFDKRRGDLIFILHLIFSILLNI